jgi:hypothetical protein
MNDALGQIAGTGVIGAVLVVALIALESEARIKDGQETLKLLMQVQSSVIDAVHKLGEIIEWAERRDAEQIREPREPRRRL